MVEKLKEKAQQLREEMLEMCIGAGDGHVTSSLSCADILTALFYSGVMKHNPEVPEWDGRDRFILSKGQASPMLYTVLADRGYFPKSHMESFAQEGGAFGVHLQKSVPGAEITCGSLGMGFGNAVGIALAAKLNRDLHLTFTLLGDGELYEGSVWEAAMFAAHNKLNNLVAIVDRNSQCAIDFTEDFLALEPIDEKFKAFCWDVKRINGNKMEELVEVLQGLNARRTVRPLVIVADTIKGAGIDYISCQPLWHGGAPIKEIDVENCRKDLEKNHG